MTWRNLAPAVALVAVLVAGWFSSTDSGAAPRVPGSAATPSPTTAAQPAAHGVEAAIATIPWSQVGPGWTLATWSAVPGGRPGAPLPPGSPTRDAATTTLSPVGPSGG